MSKLADRLKNISWPKALLGMVITCVISLSVHVVMLQVFDVPYPVGYPTTGWPVFFNLALSALALTFFYLLCADYFLPFSLPVRCLLVFVLAGMLRESLIRLPVMNSIATSAWIYSFVDALPRVITIFLVCIFVVPAAPVLSRLWQKIIGAMAIAAVVQYLCLPLVSRLFNYIRTAIAYLNHDEIYKVPYGWQIEVPAYITYAEPVIACFIMVAMIWDRLAKNMVKRTLQFALLVLIINGTFIRPFVYIFYAKFSPSLALLSMGQFFLEALSLGLLTTFTWRFCQNKT